MLNVILSGCYGKMCGVIREIIDTKPDINVSCGIDIIEGAALPFPVYHSYSDSGIKGDVIIDFSRPELLGSLLDYAVRTKTPVVIATTGFNKSAVAEIHEAAKKVPIFFTANLSIGIALLSSLVEKAAEFLGPDYDIEIVETHHNKKADAPSGTALMLAESARKGMYASKGSTGEAYELCFSRYGDEALRKKNEIGMHAVRGGTVAGEHSVFFFGDNETVELKHSAQSKQIFARGAVRAAQFLSGKPAGLYQMKDLLK